MNDQVSVVHQSQSTGLEAGRSQVHAKLLQDQNEGVPARLVPRAEQAKHSQETTDDAYLLGLIRAGDQVAMAALYDRYARYVYASALRVLHDVASAEDVVQEVFITIWRKPELLSGPRDSYKGWMLTVGRNRAVDTVRARLRRRSVPMEDVVLSSPQDYAELAEHGIMQERAGAIIAGLPDETRTLIEMAFYRGMTHMEIAEATGVPLGTVKSKIRNGLLQVRRSFAGGRRIRPAA